MKLQKIKNIIKIKLNGLKYNFDSKRISIAIKGFDGIIYDIDRYYEKNKLMCDVFRNANSTNCQRISNLNFKEFL